MPEVRRMQKCTRLTGVASRVPLLPGYYAPIPSNNVCCSYGENKLSAAESVSFNAFQKRKRVMNEREEFSMLKSMWKGKFSGSYTSADARDRYCRSLVRRANRDRKSTRLNSSHSIASRMPSSA